MKMRWDIVVFLAGDLYLLFVKSVRLEPWEVLVLPHRAEGWAAPLSTNHTQDKMTQKHCMQACIEYA
jgi:hypothetical protein